MEEELVARNEGGANADVELAHLFMPVLQVRELRMFSTSLLIY